MKKNMGILDRVLRAIGAIVIIVLYQDNVIGGTLGIVLLATSSIFLLTSFIGTCPLYLPFGITTKGKPIDYKALLNEGAKVVDVRTNREYQAGHLKGSLNIPLDDLLSSLSRIPQKDKPVILCCASGVRSARATSLLISNGYARAVNGGSWISLQSQI